MKLSRYLFIAIAACLISCGPEDPIDDDNNNGKNDPVVDNSGNSSNDDTPMSLLFRRASL